MRFTHTPVYRPLVTSLPSPDASAELETPDENYLWQHGVTVALVVCVLCTAINVALAISSTMFTPALLPLSSITRKDINRLRRPSQFIRFDQIIRPSPPIPKQFHNYPILLNQIDAGDRNKVFPDDPKRHLSSIGTISPEDRRVLVTEKVWLNHA
jgi:hypothetical protein